MKMLSEKNETWIVDVHSISQDSLFDTLFYSSNSFFVLLEAKKEKQKKNMKRARECKL